MSTPTPYAPLMTNRVRRGGLSEEIATYIRDLILTGALRPRVKIDQDAISQALHVSRSPIREALVVLGQEGLVDLTPRRGAFVADLRYDDVVDHYELFGVVSGRAAAMAATTLDDTDLERLRALHDRFEKAPLDELSDLNQSFHRLLNGVAPRRTRWLLRHLERSVPANYYEFAEGWDTKAVEGHAAIVAAVCDRNPAAARAAMEQHLHDSGIAAADALLAQGFWQDKD